MIPEDWIIMNSTRDGLPAGFKTGGAPGVESGLVSSSLISETTRRAKLQSMLNIHLKLEEDNPTSWHLVQ